MFSCLITGLHWYKIGHEKRINKVLFPCVDTLQICSFGTAGTIINHLNYFDMCTLEIMAAVEPLTKDELLMHTENADDCASVYVGTYHKYNCGSLKGAWVNLESFNDEDELMEFLHRLHADESDPELMIQDYMNFPRRFYSESMNKYDFAKLYEWLNLDEEQRQMCQEYWDEIDENASVEQIVESCVYSGNSDDYFDELADEELSMCHAPEFIRNYFDYESWRRDCSYDYNVTSNFVFSL